MEKTKPEGAKAKPLSEASHEPGAESRVADSIRVEGSPTRCPFCHDDCAATDEALVCASCLGRHHAACWSEHGRCSSCQGDTALEAGGPRSGTCSGCGMLGAAIKYSCPCCHQPTCGPCYRSRFRRCVDCATPLLQDEERLPILAEKMSQNDITYVLGFLGALGGIGGGITVVILGEVIGGLALFALGVGLGTGVGRIGIPRRRAIEQETDEVKLRLAPFQQTLRDRVREGVDGLRDGISRIFGAS